MTDEIEMIKKEMGRLAETHRRSLTQLKIYERIFHRFTVPEKLEENLDEIMNCLMETFSTEAGSIALVDPQEQDLYFAVAKGPVAQAVLNLRIPQGQGILGGCMTEKKTLAISDVKSDPRFAAQIAKQLGFDTRSILAAPIIFKGQTLGAVELINRTDTDDWSAHEIKLIESCSRAAGTFIYLDYIINPS